MKSSSHTSKSIQSKTKTKKKNLKIKIGNFTFELKKTLEYHDRILVYIGSKEIKNGNKKSGPEREFTVYTSISDLGMFKLLIWDKVDKKFLKPNDYVSSTMICFELQQFIRTNLDDIPYLSSWELYDDMLNKFKQISKLNKYYYFFTHRKKCLKDDENHILSKFEKMKNDSSLTNNITTKTQKNKLNSQLKKSKIARKTPKRNILVDEHWSKCGYYTTQKDEKQTMMKKNLMNHNLYNNYQKIKDYKGNVLPNSHIKLFKMIYNYMKKTYKTVTKGELLFTIYQEVIIKTKAVKDDPQMEIKKGSFYIEWYGMLIKVLRKTIQHKDTGKQYYYYYIEYEIDDHDYFKKKYDFSLFMVPVSSKITWFGVHDCYTYTSNYFCKPMEYTISIGKKETLDQRRIFNHHYYFFGDVLSGYII